MIIVIVTTVLVRTMPERLLTPTRATLYGIWKALPTGAIADFRVVNRREIDPFVEFPSPVLAVGEWTTGRTGAVVPSPSRHRTSFGGSVVH